MAATCNRSNINPHMMMMMMMNCSKDNRNTCEYCFPQTKHVKQLEERWTSSCRFRVRLCMYSFPQSEQLYIDSDGLLCASRTSSVYNNLFTTTSMRTTASVRPLTFHLYTLCLKKVCCLTFDHSFGKYGLIFKILSPLLIRKKILNVHTQRFPEDTDVSHNIVYENRP